MAKNKVTETDEETAGDEKKKFSMDDFLDKLFGGLDFSWRNLLTAAVITGAAAGVIQLIPLFDHTSFHRMAYYLEWWIFWMVLIPSNCKKPIESTLKTFTFFAVSRILIYLVQLPFSWMGTAVFANAQFWLIFTVYMLPAGYLMWYVNQKNWISAWILILPLVILGLTAGEGIYNVVTYFPTDLVMTVFVLFEIFVFVLHFLPTLGKRLFGFIIPYICGFMMCIASATVGITDVTTLPGNVDYTDKARLTLADDSFAAVKFTDRSQSEIEFRGSKAGSTYIFVEDGDDVYAYLLEVEARTDNDNNYTYSYQIGEPEKIR